LLQISSCTLVVFLLMFSAAGDRTAQPGCRLPNLNVQGYIKDGDVILGGIVPVCEKILSKLSFTEQPKLASSEKFNFRNYRLLHGMIFAIEEINQSKILLSNVTLGFRIYDSCGMISRAMEGTMWLITGQGESIPNYQCQLHSPLSAIIGDALSPLAISMARLLQIYHYPQISYAAGSNILSDKREFPTFFRTNPSDAFLSMALAQLVMHFGWTWVGLIALKGDYGEEGIRIVKKEIRKAGGCIAFSKIFPSYYSKEGYYHIIDVIKKSKANVIVAFTSDSSFSSLLEEIVRQNITGKVWLASGGWSLATFFSEKKFINTLSGTIGIISKRGHIPGFQDYLYTIHPSISPNDTLVKHFWEVSFRCKWLEINSNQKINNDINPGYKLCTGEEKLKELDNMFFNVNNLQYTYNIYNAVYAAAHALHDLNSCKPGEGPFANGSCADIRDFEPWQLLHYVKKVHFKMIDGRDIFFDKNGNPSPVYDILNWQITPNNTLKNVKVGSIDFTAPKGQELILNESASLWNGGRTQIPDSVCSESCPPGYRKAARLGQPACCYDCIHCSAGEFSNKTDSTECLKCTDDEWSNEGQDKCIPKLIDYLSYEEPMGIILTVISISFTFFPFMILCLFIKYRDTPLVKANNREISYLLLVGLMLSFLCSLLFIGQPWSVNCMMRQTAFGIIFALCVSCVLAKTIMVVIAFNATKPNSKLKKWVGPKLPISIVFFCTLIQIIICIAWLSSAPPFQEKDMKSEIGMIIIKCNEGSTTAFWCMLGYMGLLAIVSFIVAFLARSLPDSFNEAKFITFSMLVFVSVWLAFIPAYLSTQGKYMVAVEIFAILASSASLLACLFSPKCYIILLKPDKNTKEYLLGKGTK
uniref:G-protein coupled receptors family 3 profile domain-containing protein n=1 Tax=Latimeria chalumnae TaxID=7897 RepID=H3A1T5_LATCH